MKDTRHPAAYSKRVLHAIAAVIEREIPPEPEAPVVVLDPFAGTGRIHHLIDKPKEYSEIPAGRIKTYGIEIETEWAALHDRTYIGDALDLRATFAPEEVDVVATSPCFGNRMADHHDAKDQCKRCEGTGFVDAPLIKIGVCPDCKGVGLSKRNTYRHALGRKPSDGSAAMLRWGPEYRRFHDSFIISVLTVLRPQGVLAVNMKNHVRRAKVEPVVEWWVTTLLAHNLGLIEVVRLPSAGLRHGANHKARVEDEVLIVVRKP